MIEKYLNSRLITLYLFLLFRVSSVFSFNHLIILLMNFFILPIFFYLIVYCEKKSKSVYRKKPFKTIYLFLNFFGFGYYISGIHWITNSLTFDETFLILIPFGFDYNTSIFKFIFFNLYPYL